jgi:prepilin-type N-terminal cleavage/methylation domain-containing protein
MGDIFRKKAFTMIELMVVIVIIGVLATISVSHFSGYNEGALEKEAKSNLKLIAAAEKIYRLEVGQYVNASNETVINSVLRLMLPANSTAKNWNYTVTTNVGNTTFNATSTRTKGPMKNTVYYMTNTDEEPH